MTHVTSVDDMSDAVLRCRTLGHDWSRTFQRHWTKKKGRIVVEEIRIRTCKDCGAQKEITYEIRGGVFNPTGKRLIYPEGYVLKGQGRLTRGEAMAVEFQRAYPEMKLG